MPKVIECEWEGETYPSYSAAARVAGVPSMTMARWQAKGYTTMAAVIAAPGTKKGYSEAARELGISRQAYQQRRKRRIRRKGK